VASGDSLSSSEVVLFVFVSGDVYFDVSDCWGSAFSLDWRRRISSSRSVFLVSV
jgi:hypothetical protein